MSQAFNLTLRFLSLFASSSSFDVIGNSSLLHHQRVLENGIETVTVHEDGRLKSRTINGIPESITLE